MPSQLQVVSNAIRSRLLSFNSQGTSPMAAAGADPDPAADTAADDAISAQPGLISPTDSSHHMITYDSFNIESGAPSATPGHNTKGRREWERTGKVVQTVGLGGVGVSVTLIVNSPAASDTHRALYTAYLSVVGLGLFTGMGLSFFSILMKGSPTVGWVQKRLIFFTLFFVTVACLLRLHLALPLKDVLIGEAAVVSGMVMIVIYLCVCGRCSRQEHEPGTER